MVDAHDGQWTVKEKWRVEKFPAKTNLYARMDVWKVREQTRDGDTNLPYHGNMAETKYKKTFLQQSHYVISTMNCVIMEQM